MKDCLHANYNLYLPLYELDTLWYQSQDALCKIDEFDF